VSRTVRLNELLVGIEGLALLRHLYDGTDDAAAQRLAEVRRLLDTHDFATGESMRESDAQAGYATWAPQYDAPGNPIVGLEQPAVWSFLDRAPRGRGLDAACGTGRHARHMVELGYDVTGFDVTPEMLLVARNHVPEAEFIVGDLLAIPVPGEHYECVVCGLAVAHVPDLAGALSELARVLVSGGHLVLSALHPFQALLGWHAPFADTSGARGFVREYAHTHAEYLTAFAVAGLTVTGCREPALGADEVAAKRRAFAHIPDAALDAYVGLPAVLVWEVRKG
jgi:SAM-dependent methyltransferase